MKKAKVEFLVDKSKVAKTKYKDVSQEEVVANGRYAIQPLLHKGDQVKEVRTKKNYACMLLSL
jgi:ATP:corrinoid adenosyltransferase